MWWTALLGLVCLLASAGADGDVSPRVAAMPLAFRDDFENGADHWQPTDPAAWSIAATDGGHVYRLAKASKYRPPHRSPYNIALLRDVYLGDFILEARLKSTARDYDHRDLCLIFGYQDPVHFYYVHFGKKADDHANQIFIVNKADRKKISTESTAGTNWTDRWHQVRLVRDAAVGTIEVFFDDMEKPVMRAVDKTFAKGLVGLGSFDDTGEFDDVRVYGKLLPPDK
jgi:hypothetical protein